MTDENAAETVDDDTAEERADAAASERTDEQGEEGGDVTAGGSADATEVTEKRETTAESAIEDVTDEDTADEDATDEDALGPKSTDLVARVAIADESLAADVEEHLAELESERERARANADDYESRLKRKQADFQNYKKRAKKRQKQMEERATESLVERLIDVRDNLKRAVEDDHENVESFREGVELTLKELDRVFADEDVSEIDPDPGADVDPQRHEVMLRVESDHPEGTIADVYQPGYEMGDKVLQSAQVTVSDGNDEA